MEEKKPKKFLWVLLGILIGAILVVIGYFIYQKFIVFKPKPFEYQRPYTPPVTKIENGNFLSEKLEAPKEKLLGIFNSDPIIYTLSSPDCPHLEGIQVVPLGFTPIVSGGKSKCTVYIKQKPEKPIIFEFK